MRAKYLRRLTKNFCVLCVYSLRILSAYAFLGIVKSCSEVEDLTAEYAEKNSRNVLSGYYSASSALLAFLGIVKSCSEVEDSIAEYAEKNSRSVR